MIETYVNMSETYPSASLQLPANNTVCEVDADFEIFNGVNTADILAHIPSTDV